MVDNLVSPLDRLRSQLVRTDSENFGNLLKDKEDHYQDYVTIKKKDYPPKKTSLTGYRKYKETRTQYKYGKPKPSSRKFEDRIWLMFYRMGAEVLNKQNSRLFLDKPRKTKQIDVIAKVRNNIFIVECKSSEEGNSRSLRKDLSETANYRKEITSLCRHLWGDLVKVSFVYALDNIELSESDMSDANHYEIKVWDSLSISYFESLINLLGDAAKYQIFAETFGEEEIPEYSPRVPAIKGIARDTNFYYFLVRPSSLLKIAYIHHRKLKRGDEYENPYQRMVNKKRIEDIRDFVRRGGSFANNVIVNFKRSPNFSVDNSVEGIEYGILTLPSFYKSAWIIDGQHRLFGYTNTAESNNELIPVYAFESLSEEGQGNLFIEINKNQKSVEGNLLWDLYSDIYFESTNPYKKSLCTISRIGKELSINKDSPFRTHIYVPSLNDKSEVANVTLTTICNRLLKGSFIRRKDQEGDLFKESFDKTVDFASKRLMHFFDIIKNSNLDDWKKGEKGFSRSNIGINIFLIVFQEILKEFRRYDKNPLLSDSRYESELKKIMEPISQFLKNLGREDLKEYKASSNEKGFSENAKKICKIIHDKVPSFTPEILRSEIESYDYQDGISNPNQMIDTVEKEIRQYIHYNLLDSVGPNYWEDKHTVPEDIKREVQKRIDDELKKYPYKSKEDYRSGEKKIQFCDIPDYLKLITSKNNWAYFESTFKSKESVENKLNDLNEYRKRVKHSREDQEIDDIVKKNGEASILWFSKILEIEN